MLTNYESSKLNNHIGIFNGFNMKKRENFTRKVETFKKRFEILLIFINHYIYFIHGVPTLNRKPRIGQFMMTVLNLKNYFNKSGIVFEL